MIIEMTGVTKSSAFQKLEDESNVLSSDHRKFIHGAHGGHGCFFSSLKARNLGGKSFLRMACGQKSIWIHGSHGGHGCFFSSLKARNLGGNL